MANPIKWLDDLISSGASGVNSVWLKRAADAGVIKPGMSADEIYRAASGMAVPPPTRQLQLPMGSDSAGDGVRSLIPYDNGARGFQMGANNTRTPATVPSPGTGMIPSPPRGLGGPAQPRIGTTAGVRSGGSYESLSPADQSAWDDMVRQFDTERPFALDANGQITMSPRGLALSREGQKALPAPARKTLPAPASTAMRDQQAVDGIASQFDNVMGGRAPTEDLQLAPYGYSGSRAASAAPASGGIPAWAKAAAGAGLIGAGATAYNMMPKGMRSKESEAVGELDSTDGTADLVEESRPAPKVEAPPAPEVSPRDQAQALIAKLNQMRRQAGGEVPEAPQMMQEINRLMAMSNQSRNAMTPQQAQGSNDPHIQAQALIAQLNEMRQRAGGEVPQAQQIMAEVRRLQAMGDQQRNYAQTR